MTRGRRPDADDRETRALDVVDNLCCLAGSVEFLPPSTLCGWMEAGAVDGGAVYCLPCSPHAPTVRHAPVDLDS